MNKKIYLDNACTSIVQPRVLEAAKHYTDLISGSDKSASDVTRECRSYLTDARKKVAEFINASPEEIALVECTSHAMGILANILPLEKGDNVLVADLEYQASILCFETRKKHVGFEVREVRTEGGRLSVEDFKKYFDDRTRVIVVAAVQEINGWRTDIRAIADFLKDKNCYLVVDGIQECGAMKVDVKAMGADFYCAGGKKWLGNPFGKGFLFVRKELIPALEPPFLSYFKIKMKGNYTDYINYLECPGRDPFDEFEVIEEASKFENGGYDNYLGALGLMEAMNAQLEIGQENIETKIRSLTRRYRNGLKALGLTPQGEGDEKNQSAIVSFNFGFKDGNIEKERRLIRFLQDRNIYVSLRSSTWCGGIRTSMHYYNTEEDIDTLLAGIRDFLDGDR